MNELSSLIKKYQTLKNIKRNQLAKSLGYINITKALRRLDAFIDVPNIKSDFANKLRSTLDIPLDEYESSIKKVHLRAHIKAKERFKPSLEIILSGRPSPVFAAAFFICLELPQKLQSMPYEEEISAIFNAYKEDQINKFKNSSFYINANEDYSSFVKNIEKENLIKISMGWALGDGFRYFRAFNDTLYFDRLGQLIKRTQKTNHSSVQLTVNGKDVLPLLK